MPSVITLNSAQMEAVSTTEGPLMIIAGAGTGKTGVITSRIVHLINELKIDPKHILALTFTEKAAAEMEERVDMMMPLSYEGAFIGTFHAFCDTVLRESGFHIGIDPSYKIINQARQWLLIKNNLFDLGLDYYRPLNNPAKFINMLISHFSRLKDEDIRPETYLELANAKKLSATTDVESESAVQMMEIAGVYGKYQDIKVAGGVLDFGDLQYYVLRLFEKSPGVLEYYRNRFKYILVDEYQDTNFAQNKIVMMLAGANGNIAVVGDDDQSIYKWRGASLSNLLSFELSFPNVKKVILNDNYRSAQKILDLSHFVIQRNNPERLEYRQNINKQLVAAGDNGESEIKLTHYSNYLEEARDTARKVLELAGQCNYGNIAILVRANQHASPFTEVFKEAGIPFNVRDTQSLTKFEEIKDLLAFLRFVYKPYNDVAFARLLSMELFGIPMHEVLDIFKRARDDDYKPGFYYLKDSFKQQSISVNDAHELVKKLFNLLDELLNFSRRQSIGRIIGEFLDKSGYFKALAKDADVNADKLKRIARFLEIAHDFEFESGDNSVRTFLDYLDSMDEAGGLKDDSQCIDDNAVSILTIHSAKGLEFDHVFLPSMVAQRFPSTSRREPLEIPSELIEERVAENESNLPEERRLFYVACTRARKNLYISYSDKYEGNKKWKVSPFVTEALESGIVEESEFCSDGGRPSGMSVSSLDERVHQGLIEAEDGQRGIAGYVPELIINRLSYSQIDAFKTCPLKYKFRYIFKIPTPSPHAANFGSSVHDAVNRFYRNIGEGEKPTMDLLAELYEKCWIGGGYLSKAHENARKQKGLEMMEIFFNHEKENDFKVPAFMERNFRLKVAGVAFSGRIDRIDRLEDGSFEVIDYKTGSSKRDVNLKKDLQLSVYALACRDVFRLNVSKYSLFYLEDSYKASTARSNEEIENVKTVLDDIAEEMKKSDFDATPGFNCGYCEYRILCDKAQ